MTSSAKPKSSATKRARPVAPGRLHRTKAFEIPGLAGARPLTLYLPPGYDAAPDRRYPVAYMFDGQNLFSDDGAYSGGWHLHRLLDARAARGLVVPVVVGIHHGGEHRIEELTPWPVEPAKTAKGDALLDWVVGPLAKMVREDLRVLEGPHHTMVGGSSLGGLLALYAYFRHNDIFGRVLSMSPSLWVDEGAIFPYVAKARAGGDPRLYLDCGAKEAKGIVVKHAEWMAELLERKGFVPDHHLLWRADARGAHNERAWRRRLPKALKFLYG